MLPLETRQALRKIRKDEAYRDRRKSDEAIQLDTGTLKPQPERKFERKPTTETVTELPNADRPEGEAVNPVSTSEPVTPSAPVATPEPIQAPAGDKGKATTGKAAAKPAAAPVNPSPWPGKLADPTA